MEHYANANSELLMKDAEDEKDRKNGSLEIKEEKKVCLLDTCKIRDDAEVFQWPIRQFKGNTTCPLVIMYPADPPVKITFHF